VEIEFRAPYAIDAKPNSLVDYHTGVSDLETHVKFLTHHIQQLLAAGGAVTPGQTPASTPHATPAFGLSPARESASPPPSQQQFNPFQPLVPYATAAQMAAPPPPPPQA